MLNEQQHYLWFSAMQAIQMAAVENARMMYWCKTPEKEQVPDLVLMIGLWAEADFKTRQLKVIDHQPGDADLLSISDIQDEVATLEGFMTASEEFQPQLYPNTLAEQIQQRIYMVSDFANTFSQSGDDEDLETLLYERDLLQYARSGVQTLQREGNLKQIKLDAFTEGLKLLDENFIRPALAAHPTIEKHKPPYVTDTFWWWE